MRKKKLWHKAMALAMASMITVGSVAGCSGSTEDTSDTTDVTEAVTDDAEAETEEEEEVVYETDENGVEQIVETIVEATGTTSGNLDAEGVFYADYSSNEELAEAGNSVHLEMVEEGQVLLKNDNDALPLSEDEMNITFLGIGTIDYVRSGGGSGATTGTDYALDWVTAFEQEGFKVNPKTIELYENLFTAMGGAHDASDSGGLLEPDMSYYSNSVTSTFSSYSDAAIVCISRYGQENIDLETNNVEGHSDENDHYLQLDDNELELIKLAKTYFDKVIVIINSSNIMQIPELEADTDTEYGVDAILWVGGLGDQGTLAAAEILTGEVNPSGHTVDIWPSDFTQDPTFFNYGDMSQNVGEDSERMSSYLTYSDGTTSVYSDVEYREGIYYGYRYYEIKADDMDDAEEGSGEAWYEENVTYPFGYGLSYTTFEWELAGISSSLTIEGPAQTITMKVKVTNTGEVAGKDVVQLYVTAPYYEGEIEKAHKVLVGYAKTDELEPGETGTVTLTFDPYDCASYDYSDANDNGFAGYEVESGEYILSVSLNAHEAVEEIVCTLDEDILYETDPDTGAEVTNRYTDTEDTMSSDAQLSTVLSRADWEGTWPDEPTDEERAGSEQLYEELADTSTNNPNDYSDEEYPWFGEETDLTLQDMLPEETPEATSEPIVDYDNELWDEILDACTEDELLDLINYGAYHTVSIESIGLPSTIHGDGPSGFTCFLNSEQISDTCQYVSEPVMAATWNVELMEELGRTMGEEALFGDTDSGTTYAAIYAPGVNIHRSPFGGRCSEYFSEDPYLSGIMAAAEIRGCQEMGVLCMVKHFAANEQETHRSINGDCSWLTEQSLREIYLKPFEKAVKEGGTRGVMSSFNRIGTKWTGGDYRLLTEILREEWGFEGAVICDFNTIPQYMNVRQMFYAGGDLDLATTSTSMWTDIDTSDTADAIVLRRAAKNVMYALVNSNAMNGEVIGYKMAIWRIVMYSIDVGLAVLLALWGGLLFLKYRRERKKAIVTIEPDREGSA